MLDLLPYFNSHVHPLILFLMSIRITCSCNFITVESSLLLPSSVLASYTIACVSGPLHIGVFIYYQSFPLLYAVSDADFLLSSCLESATSLTSVIVINIP